MKLVRNYLTSDELIAIVDTLVGIDNCAERHIVKIATVLQCVCDLSNIKWENCNDLYDEYVKQTDFDLDYDINNFYTIDKIVDKELSVDKSVRLFLSELESSLKNVDVEKITNQLTDLKEVIK